MAVGYRINKPDSVYQTPLPRQLATALFVVNSILHRVLFVTMEPLPYQSPAL